MCSISETWMCIFFSSSPPIFSTFDGFFVGIFIPLILSWIGEKPTQSKTGNVFTRRNGLICCHELRIPACCFRSQDFINASIHQDFLNGKMPFLYVLRPWFYYLSGKILCEIQRLFCQTYMRLLLSPVSFLHPPLICPYFPIQADIIGAWTLNTAISFQI